MGKRRTPLRRPKPPEKPELLPLPKNRGRTFQPTDEQRKIVVNMAGFGFTEDDIRLLVQGKDGKPISRVTLRKYFEENLRTGKVRANYEVAGFLFKAAKDGNVSAMIFWLKTQARWKEQIEAEQDPTQAVPTKVVIEFKDGRVQPDAKAPAAAPGEPAAPAIKVPIRGLPPVQPKGA